MVKELDGKEYSKEREHIIGSLKEPLTMQQFQDLYSKFTQGILTQAQIEDTTESIIHLEQLGDIEKFMNILTYRSGISDM